MCTPSLTRACGLRRATRAATHSTPTLQKAHNCPTRALRHAEDRDLVKRNVSLVDTPRGREGRPSKALTVEQAAALLDAAEDARLHAFIVLCLLTGVRSEEARALAWDHVDLEAGTVSVWRSSPYSPVNRNSARQGPSRWTTSQ